MDGIRKIKDKNVRKVITLLLREIFRDIPHLHSVVLFGSLARNEKKKCADIDLIVVANGDNKSLSKRADEIIDCFILVKKTDEYWDIVKKGYFFNLSPIPYTPEELIDTPPLLLDVVEDGIILFDDGTMQRKLSELKKRLKELGARRVKRGKTWYWILKPDLRPGEVIEL